MSKNKIEKLPVLQFRAQVSSESLSRKDNSIRVVASTGSKGLRETYFGNYYEELSLDEKHVDMSHLKSGRAKFLAAHDMRNLDSVIGVVTSAKLNKDNITAEVRFSDDEISQRHLSKIRSGILSDVSIGYVVRTYTDVSKEGDKIPTLRATDYSIVEISLVPQGFDPGAKVERSQDEERMSEVQIISNKNEPEAVHTQRDQFPKETSMTPQEAALAERTRIRALKQVGRESGVDETTIDTWIDTGLSEDEAKVRALKFQAMQYDNQRSVAKSIDSTLRVEVGTSNRAGKLEQAAEALAFRINPSLKPKENSEFVGRSMVQILERSIVDRKLGMSNEQVVARAMSSSDFPLLLANTAEKVAAARYQLAPKNWSKFAATDVLRNFKLNNVVRGGDFPSLSEVEEGGEIQNGSFGEKQEQVQLKSWGRIVGLTRRALVNDDLVQLALVANDAGTSAARLENKLVFDVLKNNSAMSDGYNLFSSQHANLGTGAAISDTSIGEAFKLMRQQKTDDGLDQLNLNPKFMIVGPESEALARKYLAQLNPASVSDVNVWAGSLELIVDSEINSNDYFFVADPKMARAIMLYRLEGYESPRIETRVDFRSESVEIKCAHDAAAAAIDHRPLVKNANAS